MSDLSRLLDDVYGDTAPGAEQAPPAPPSAPLAGLPDWAVDSVLDEAFADWVPGPPTVAVDAQDDAGATDQRVASGIPRSAFTDLAEAPAPVAEAPHAWSRQDDDILPTGRRRGAKRGRGIHPDVPEAAAPVEAPAGNETDNDADAEQVEAAAPVEVQPGRFRRRKG